MTLFEELKWRGLIKDMTDPKIEKLLNEESVTFYIGTDPTGDSLHIGHLSSFLICKRLADAGHHPIILVGGATGLIGDPRPSSEREIISYDKVKENVAKLTKQIHKVFGDFEFVNNYDWSEGVDFITFLRDYGKFFNVNYMLAKDIVKRRLDEGITYTEFSYQIMQAMDFYILYHTKNCIMQVAGQDQWGNITAGVDLIRKKAGKEAYAFTMPLVTKKDGTKFGKSEGKAIWLDAKKTSPYEFYQFFVNSEDEMVIDYLKRFTFLSRDEIEELERKHKEHPEYREAHKALAFEVTKFVHGEEEAIKAQKTSEEVFSGGMSVDMPSIEVDVSMGSNILDVLVGSELAPSKSEARRLVEQGGISIDGEKITDAKFNVDKKEIVIQKGKKIYKKVTLKR
ncbi:MAG TPA: tyrosine--tRNA ligase [Firmicutes bacterium]|nr:tyrosine--tRNA ligase [Bacillota bacterium]